MNPLQLAQQIKAELQAVAWPGGSTHLVFGADGVFVSAGTPSADQIPPGFPWVLVGIGSGTMDPDHPELITQTFGLMVATEVAGDPQGEFSLIGGAIEERGKSAGRGVLEVAERARAAVQSLTGIDGAKILVTASASGGPFWLENRARHMAVHELTLQALCTSAVHYAAPQNLAYDSGDTAFSWTGGHCSSRFDFMQYRLVELAGSSPSADPSDGSVVYTGTAATTAYTAQNGYTYTVFADYDERSAGTPDGSSDPEVGSYVVISA